MDDLQEKRCRCKLCGAIFKNSGMSEGYYPARSTGNDDIVALDIIKMFESLQSPKVYPERLFTSKDNRSVFLEKYQEYL